MELIDIGVNLTNSRLYHNRNKLKEQAIQAGIHHQIVTGTCLESSIKALQICQEDPDYYSCTVGCHPHDAKDFRDTHLAQLKDLANSKSAVAIGECGLDFNRNYSPQDVQVEVFQQQINLACQSEMPLFMHQRDAHETLVRILKPFLGKYINGVVHCFTGDKHELKDYLDLGLYVGITGWLCDERRGQELQEALRYAPLDRIMFETDAPYLLPRTIRPRPKSNANVPANLPWVVSKAAQICNQSETELASICTENSRRFFNLSQ